MRNRIVHVGHNIRIPVRKRYDAMDRDRGTEGGGGDLGAITPPKYHAETRLALDCLSPGLGDCYEKRIQKGNPGFA